MQLSIIIPVYNVEKYITRCLDSCVNQDYDASEYEIIVVNDGTPDNSVAIIERYVAKYSNLRLINRENGGLSAARNTGLKEAKGKYIWFIDSDDWIKENCLKEINALLTDNIDELVIGGNNVSDTTNEFLGYRNLYPKYHLKTLSGIETWEKGICQLSAAVFAIYRKEFLIDNNLFFIEGIYHEDAEFCPKASYLSKATCFYSEVIYYVRQNPNSITRSFNAKKSFDDIIVAQSLLQFIEKEQISGPIRKYFLKFISVIINNSFHDIAIGDNNTIKTFEEYFRRSEVSSALLSSKQFKYMIEWFLISCNFAPLKVYKVLSLFKKSTWIKILYKNK